MLIIRSSGIEAGLKQNGRVYLCGNLEKANGVQHIQTEGYEIGISDYPSYTFEKPHLHAFNREYNYVLSGAIKILLLSEKKEYLFQAGDLFVLTVDEPYVGKCAPNTRTIFSKVPGGNDKVLVELTPAIANWGRSWDSVYEEGEA